MTSPSRMLAILGLFTEDHPVWQTDALNEALGYSRATGYRYVKDLVAAGLLQKVAAGRYALGARIIELDYRLRRSDPVLRAAAPVMEALVRRTRLDAVLSAMFGARVVDTHRVSGDAALELQYGRGHPRPLFQGAAPKVLMACRPRAQLVRLHAQHADEIAAHGLGDSWAGFRDRMAVIRRAGFHLSLGELEPGIGAAAVPLTGEDGEVLAALALVGTVDRLQALGAARLQAVLGKAAAQVREAMTGGR